MAIAQQDFEVHCRREAEEAARKGGSGGIPEFAGLIKSPRMYDHLTINPSFCFSGLRVLGE